jgi:hypothetical protein
MWAKVGGDFDQKMAISREIRKKIWWRQRDSNPSSFVEIIQEIAKNDGE